MCSCVPVCVCDGVRVYVSAHERLLQRHVGNVENLLDYGLLF